MSLARCNFLARKTKKKIIVGTLWLVIILRKKNRLVLFHAIMVFFNHAMEALMQRFFRHVIFLLFIMGSSVVHAQFSLSSPMGQALILSAEDTQHKSQTHNSHEESTKGWIILAMLYFILPGLLLSYLFFYKKVNIFSLYSTPPPEKK